MVDANVNLDRGNIGSVTGMRWTGSPNRNTDQNGKNGLQISKLCLRRGFWQFSDNLWIFFGHVSTFFMVLVAGLSNDLPVTTLEKYENTPLMLRSSLNQSLLLMVLRSNGENFWVNFELDLFGPFSPKKESLKNSPKKIRP